MECRDAASHHPAALQPWPSRRTGAGDETLKHAVYPALPTIQGDEQKTGKMSFSLDIQSEMY